MTTTHSTRTLDTSPGPSQEGLKTQLEFYQLSRPVQDRLLLSLAGEGVPAPSLFVPASERPPWIWLGLLAVSLVGLLLLTRTGFGNLEHPLAIQRPWVGLGYTLAGAGVGLAVLGALRSRGRAGRYPYRLGHYLFPSGVLTMVTDRALLLPITELRAVTPAGRGAVQLEFPSQKVTFSLPSGMTVPELEGLVSGFRSQFEAAWSQKNRRALAALDPTRDSGFSNPLSSADRLRPAADRRSIRFALVVILGASVGAGWFYTRNRLAERALFRRAVTENSGTALASYLERGGERPEVGEILLPRAELAACQGSLAAVEQFAASHPNSKIQGEIDAALRTELLQELNRVQAAGTLRALEDFKSQHTTHSLVLPELAQMRHQLYQNALARYRQNYAPEAAAAAAIAELLKFAEANGPKVEVRFQRSVTSSLERADSAIRRSGYYTGSQAIPSRYFDTPHAEAREQAVGASLVEQLQAAFPSEILQFSLGAGLEGTGAPPAATVPTLFVSYVTNMSGGFTTNRPRGVYVGLGVTIQSSLILPPATSAYEFKDSSWIAPDVNEISRNMMTPKDVYETNARTALERFRDRLLRRLLPTAKTP